MNTTSSPFSHGALPAPPSQQQNTSFADGFSKCNAFAPPGVLSQQMMSTKHNQGDNNCVSSSGSSFSKLQAPYFGSSQAAASKSSSNSNNNNNNNSSSSSSSNNDKTGTQWEDNRPDDPMEICYYFPAFCENGTEHYQIPRL